MASNAMTTALALPSSKTNWTATVPARAPPPPPPVTQATMLKRTHEIQCGKCAISDYAENIGVWNDDGTLQELGMCGECEKPDIVGCCECCECDVTTDQDYLKLKTGPGAGRIYCEEHVGWGECQKAWSASCGCDVCADEEEEEQRCEGCGTTCLDHTSNKGRGSESPCEECGETRCKFCPCECEEATTEFARNKICDECGCKGGCELTCVYVCGEDEEKDIVGCCEKCDMEIVRDSDEHDNCLIGADDKFYCQHCPAAMCEMCEVCYTNGGSISVLGRDISICENCDKGGDCYDGFLDEYHYNAETNDYEEKEEEQNECEICAATPDINDDWHGNSVCDECFMCCEECSNTKNPAVFEKTASDLCECEDIVQCEHCDGAVSDEGGIIVVMGQEMTICESCDMGGDCYDGFLDEYHYNAETNDYEEKKEEDSDEVKQYKAVLAETLRYEAIMDMMKK